MDGFQVASAKRSSADVFHSVLLPIMEPRVRARDDRRSSLWRGPLYRVAVALPIPGAGKKERTRGS